MDMDAVAHGFTQRPLEHIGVHTHAHTLTNNNNDNNTDHNNDDDEKYVISSVYQCMCTYL